MSDWPAKRCDRCKTIEICTMSPSGIPVYPDTWGSVRLTLRSSTEHDLCPGCFQLIDSIIFDKNKDIGRR